MLTTNKHNKTAGWKYLLLLPLIGGMVLMSGWTVSAQNQDTGKKAQVKKEVAQKLQEIGFTKSGDDTWTKDGITMRLSEGQPAVTQEPGKGKVHISMTVLQTGNISNVKVIRGVDPLLDEEALRVVKSSPKWIPATVKGKPVNFNMVLPVNFTLSKDGGKK